MAQISGSNTRQLTLMQNLKFGIALLTKSFLEAGAIRPPHELQQTSYQEPPWDSLARAGQNIHKRYIPGGN